MKIALALLVVGIALCQMNSANGFILGRPFGLGLGLGGFGPWGMRPWGLGLGGPWGGLGWGGLGWGGLGGWGGPWGGLGFGRFGLGGFGRFGLGGFGFRGGFGGFRGIRGKRDSSEIETTKVVSTGDKTLCSFSSKNNVVTCHGAKHNFQCEAIPQFTELSAGTYRIHNLTVVPVEIEVDSVEQRVYHLFSRNPVDQLLNRFTMIEKPEKKVTFSVFRSENVKNNGLRIESETCWKSFENMIRESKPEHVRFALFITKKTVVA